VTLRRGGNRLHDAAGRLGGYGYPIPMCGRYRLCRGKEVAEKFAIEEDLEWTPRYNIAPSDQIPTIRQDATEPVRHVALMRWGMIPFV
jgi:putative SOS response-associated peptidase YedK